MGQEAPEGHPLRRVYTANVWPAEIPEIERFPAPICIFTRFGESSLDFELRIWVHRSDDWPNVRSAALMAVHGKLTEAGIEIPFPQRDLHLRSIDGAVARQLPGGLEAQTDPSERTQPRPA